jgi:CheY-like chemotaxis protein
VARILMVDDDPQMQATLPLVLADGGHQVTLAANGKQALRELRTRPIDLVLTDILMPEMDGLELIRAVKKDHPGVKLLAISGGSARLPGTDALQVARLLGARRVLPKPFSADEVIAAVADALASE